MTTATASALKQLEGLRQAHRAAERRVAELEAVRNQLPRRFQTEQGKLRAYFEAVERGEREPDRLEERKLRKAVADIDERLGRELRTDRGHTREVIVDVEAEARLDAARDQAEDAGNAIGAFILERRADLEAELTARALAARDALMDAIEGLSRAAGEWSATRRAWLDFGEQWAGNPGPLDVPLNPLPGVAMQDIELVAMQVAGGAKDPRGVIPMPSSMAPGADQEERHQTPLRGWEQVPRVWGSANA